MQNVLLMRGSQIIIPPPIHPNILAKLHTGHLGISKCREKARNSVWWPNLSRQLADLVINCTTCPKFQKPAPEPLMPSVLPTLTWQNVASDLFKWKGATYLLFVDYFSKYIEISKLNNETSHEVILRLKSILARHSIPLEVFSDNGPQYSSMEFADFAKSCLSTPPAALNFPRVMGKQRELSTLSKLCYRRLKTFIQHCWHTSQHQSVVATAQQRS